MTDLKQWLEAQGLAQYAKVFANNDIDSDVLADLCEPHAEAREVLSSGR
ncbi:MAG TPA: SAM domain-containing protein [Casimicrobiaceae bacterium]